MYSLMNWFRRTLPPLWAILLVLMFYITLEGLYLWAIWCIHEPSVVADFTKLCLHIRDTSIAAITAIYGIFRVLAFHPLFRPQYRAWLSQTPWNGRKPLPFGPIHLLWQDVILLAIVVLSLHGSTHSRVWPVISFLFAYLMILGYSFWRTGPRWMGYFVFFGLALIIRLAPYPILGFGILVAVYACSMIGLRMALNNFPWYDSQLLEDLSRPFLLNTPPRQKSISIWPFSQLLNVSKQDIVNRSDGILGPLLGAWWIHAITSNVQKTEDQLGFVAFLLGASTFFSFLTRILMYIGPCWPPISLWGRIFTRRWIIPGYDYVLVAPLFIVFAALIGWVLAEVVGPPYYSITYPISTAVVTMIALNMGPSLKKWQLTGHHRIVCLDSNTKNSGQLKL